MGSSGGREKSKERQRRRQLERNKGSHGGIGIASSKIGRDIHKRDSIEDVIVGMSEPTRKGNDLIQCRIYYSHRTRGASARRNVAATA